MVIDKKTLYDYLQHQQGIEGGVNVILASKDKEQLTEGSLKRMKSNGGPLDAKDFINKQALRLVESYTAYNTKIKNSSYAAYLKQKCVENNADFDGVVAIIALESRGDIKAVEGVYQGIFQINKDYGINGFDPIKSIDWYFLNRKKNIAYRLRKGINDDGSVNVDAGTAEFERKQIDELKDKIDLDAFLLHNATLETHQVNVTWGSRTNSSEYSDWIGLKQYILFLCKTYCPHVLVPFAELIPKFTYEGNAKLRSSEEGGDELNIISDIQTTRYNQMVDVYNSLRDSGGIDILTIDPFLDIQSYKDDRGLTFKTVGNLTFNPENNSSTLSKPGGVGVESIKVEIAQQSNQGLSMVTVIMKDIMGNKFLDAASPWSFILNKQQYGGDFLFRFGWQLTLPNPTSNYEDIGYKFWNHEGWKLFDNELKTKLISKLQANNNTINLTQSLRERSLFYNGWEIQKNNETGVSEFVKGLITSPKDSNIYYMSLTMLMPSISVDPVNGAITATLVFQTTSDLANFMAPVVNNENIKKLIESTKNNTVSLYNLMIAFIDDNEAYIDSLEDEKQKEKFKSYKSSKPINDIPEERMQLIQVIALEDYKTGMSDLKLIDPKDINIYISNDDINRLNATTENNTTLWAWIISVITENNLSVASTSNSQTGLFNFLYDNGSLKLSDSGFTLLDEKQVQQATGFLTTGDYERILLDDDVYSFRFQGTLIQDLQIESTDEETAQSIQANVVHAENDVLNSGLSGNVNKENASEGNSTNVSVPEKNKQILQPDIFGNMINYGKNITNQYDNLMNYTQKLQNSNPENSSQLFIGAKELMQDALSIALSYKGTKETPVNTGAIINMFQQSTGNSPGQPWCMSFVYFCYQKAADQRNIKNPLIKTGGVLNQWSSINPKFKTKTPSPGAIFIMNFGGSKGHTGIVVSVSDDGKSFTTIEGNTNQANSREGDGVYERTRKLSSVIGFISFAQLSNDDVETISPTGANYNNQYLLERVQTNSLNTKNDMLKIYLSRMRNANIKMIGHPWVQFGRSFYIKGTGNFDGKYYYSKIEHTIENNQFTTNIYGVSIIFNDNLYSEMEAQKRQSTLGETTGLELQAERVGTQTFIQPVNANEVFRENSQQRTQNNNNDNIINSINKSLGINFSL